MSTIADGEELETCVAQSLRRWLFPRPSDGSPVGVSLPFTIGAADG